MDFSTIEIALKKVRGNNVDFSTSKIVLKKVLGNDMVFLTIEITLKKQKWRGNLSKFGLRHMYVISTSNPRRFDVVCSRWVVVTSLRRVKW